MAAFTSCWARVMEMSSRSAHLAQRPALQAMHVEGKPRALGKLDKGRGQGAQLVAMDQNRLDRRLVARHRGDLLAAGRHNGLCIDRLAQVSARLRTMA